MMDKETRLTSYRTAGHNQEATASDQDSVPTYYAPKPTQTTVAITIASVPSPDADSNRFEDQARQSKCVDSLRQ